MQITLLKAGHFVQVWKELQQHNADILEKNTQENSSGCFSGRYNGILNIQTLQGIPGLL